MKYFKGDVYSANFIELVNNIPTQFYIYETKKHFFLYINQNIDNNVNRKIQNNINNVNNSIDSNLDINLYDEYVLRLLQDNKLKKGKELFVCCNLDNDECINDLENVLVKMFR